MKFTCKILLFLSAWSHLFTQCEKELKINFLDKVFLDALIEGGVDTDGDGEISISEAEAVITLDVADREIKDITGIESFVNLETLICSGNQ